MKKITVREFCTAAFLVGVNRHKGGVPEPQIRAAPNTLAKGHQRTAIMAQHPIRDAWNQAAVSLIIESKRLKFGDLLGNRILT